MITVSEKLKVKIFLHSRLKFCYFLPFFGFPTDFLKTQSLAQRNFFEISSLFRKETGEETMTLYREIKKNLY